MRSWLDEYKWDILLIVVFFVIGMFIIALQPKGSFWHMLVFIPLWFGQYTLKKKRQDKKNKN